MRSVPQSDPLAMGEQAASIRERLALGEPVGADEFRQVIQGGHPTTTNLRDRLRRHEAERREVA